MKDDYNRKHYEDDLRTTKIKFKLLNYVASATQREYFTADTK